MGTKNYNNYSDMITFSRASTGTYLDSDGLLKSAAINTPRVEYDYQGNRLGLLVEEARTNTIGDSDVFLADAGTAVSASAEIAPDGTTTATQALTSGASTHRVRRTAGVVTATGVAYAYSVFVKSDEVSYIQLLNGGDANYFATFDLVNETVESTGSATTGTITKYPNGWYRITALYDGTGNYSSTGYIYAAPSASATYGQAANTPGLTFHLFGAQNEAGAFPTSYIPTSGATATRSLDITTLPDSSKIWNKGAGTFVATFDYSDPSNVNNNYVMGGSATARVIYNNTGNNLWQSYDGTASTSFYDVEGDSSVYKLAVSVKESATSTSAKNGLIVGTRSGSALMSELVASSIVSVGGGSSTQMLNGHISSIAYYPRRLTDAQIKALTSPPETPTLSLTFDDSSTSYLETSIHG